jgi:hypothetical protein
MTAEKTVGSSAAHAVMSHLGIENGFLVYTIFLTIDSNNNMHRRVIVDAGNGKVLSNQQIPMREAMVMHGGGMMMALRWEGFTHKNSITYIAAEVDLTTTTTSFCLSPVLS